MVEVRLTKNARKLIRVLYRQYHKRCKQGVAKAEARFFGGAASIQEKLLPRWTVEDIDYACRELRDAEYLNCFILDNVVAETALENKGIAYMENQFWTVTSALFGLLDKIRLFTSW